MRFNHTEWHRIENIGWLRAAVLGANDGIISTASLLIGVAAAPSQHSGLLIVGFAAMIAGAMSMAAGEYVSVSSQADTENAEIEREKHELETDLPAEIEELTTIYIKYGLDRALAAQVANQMMSRDALGTHMRDELGLTKTLKARPLQAALFSACTFSMGAFLAIIVAIFTPLSFFIPVMFVMTIVFLAFLGGLSAKIGGSSILTGVVRVTVWGTLAMLLTAIIGSFLGTTTV